jgi:polyphosphate kinase 2 (PPK2 family)
VEGFCAEADWRRAYAEINDFEEQLFRHGTVLAKFWLAISKEEQLARFKERDDRPRYKIGPRTGATGKGVAYEDAVSEMVDRPRRSWP